MKTVFSLLALLLLISCNNDDNNTPFEPSPINFTEIGKGGLSGNQGIVESNLVITNSTDWQNLITQMNTFSNVSQNFTQTDIDFSNYLVLAVFTEIKKFPWRVDITEITEYEDKIILTSFEDIISTASVVTQPFHIVKIPKTNKPIEFENTSVLDE